MILAWQNNEVKGKHADTQMEDIRPLYTSHQFLRAPDDTVFVVIHHSDPVADRPGEPTEPDQPPNPPVPQPNFEWDEVTLILEEIQPAGFAADTLLFWDGAAWVLSPANETTQNQRTVRRPNALSELKNPNLRDMIIAGKNKPDADAWVAAQTSIADAVAQSVMLTSRLSRFLIHQEEDFFTPGE